MSQRSKLLSFSLLCVFSTLGIAQTLSVNSGINSADTHVVVDLTVTGSTTLTLPASFYNPANGTTSSSLTVTPATQTFHVESGYDTSGGMVMNIWPTGTPVNGNSTDAEAIGFIRLGGGQITVFGQNGAPLALQFPTNIPTVWPLSLFGSNPGSSVISNLVVPNVQTYANELHANYVTSQNPTADYVTVTQPNGSTAAWTYVPSGSNWVAQQLVITPVISSGNTSRTIQFANLGWYDNATNDAARAAKGYTGILPPNPVTTNPSGITVNTPGNGSTTVTNLGGPQNVSFMHGFKSSSSTWTRMTNWLNQDFRFGEEVVPTFSWSDHLNTQGGELVNEINSVGGSNYILIGHSQGGLVSRSAAQQYQTANNKQTTVTGVVTLDSPNTGAPIAVTGGPTILAGLEFLGAWLWDVTGCNTANDNFVCYMAALVFFGGPVVADVWYSTNPDMQDMIPNSTFLNGLNAYAESFKRAGIVSYTPLRWDETRILDNALFLGTVGCYPETGCGERDIAAITDGVYNEVVGLFVFCIFEEIFDPDNADYWASEAFYFLEILVGMDVVDGFWNIIVSGLQPSDGLVPTSSQSYPSSSAVQYPIYGADSHTGATTSTYVHATLDQVLGGSQFQVPTQASCTFSPSPTSLSISPAGGSSSFSLGTGTGCQWSAASQVPWITITSGTSGTGPGTVDFSIAANPETVPRMGTIQAGNGSSSMFFTVVEVGVCSYSLSNALLTFSPGGGSGTVTVTTQTGCVWSAVPNATWLTITSGASGTGSGSFTFSAAPGNTNMSFTGTVTVMSQILTIIVGSSVGTPGTGTVTISGHARSGYSCPPGCREKSCCSLVWESGTVYVTVGGVTFRASYGGSTASTTGVATDLATAISNSTTSPVTATASSNVVTITSKLKGAATNYSLSTSYSYDTTIFTSPAFTGAASGTQLTGGTD
jgi:triacylglycerol esterase/lipase EstA (alpha/beta hydrolase family)